MKQGEGNRLRLRLRVRVRLRSPRLPFPRGRLENSHLKVNRLTTRINIELFKHWKVNTKVNKVNTAPSSTCRAASGNSWMADDGCWMWATGLAGKYVNVHPPCLFQSRVRRWRLHCGKQSTWINLDSLGLLGFSLGFYLDSTWILPGLNLD